MLRSAGWLVVTTLFLGACSGDGDGTQVKGITVEREPSGTATRDPASSPSPSPSPQATAAPTGQATTSAPQPEPTVQSEPTTTSAPSPRPTTPPPPPPSPSPTQTASPTPAAVVLGDGSSGGFSRWDPHTEPPEECCWVELAGAPPQSRDYDASQALRASLFDPQPAEPGQEPWQRQVRQATCDGVIVAPSDRGVVARGTATVDIAYGDGTLVQQAFAVDVTLAPGERHVLPRPEPGTVDAADGLTVSCTLRFDAA